MVLETYIDDTAISSINNNSITASKNLQKHTSKIENWSKMVNKNKRKLIWPYYIHLE